MSSSALRRLQVLSGQLGSGAAAAPTSSDEVSVPQLTMQACAGTSMPYASATGAPNSYARVHGDVSRAPARWRSIPSVAKEQLTDVVYEKAEGEGIAKITINRPEKRNAFRPRTVHELSLCFADARDDPDVGVIVLTGAGDLAFCSGGDQEVRGKGGYVGELPRWDLSVLSSAITIFCTCLQHPACQCYAAAAAKALAAAAANALASCTESGSVETPLLMCWEDMQCFCPLLLCQSC